MEEIFVIVVKKILDGNILVGLITILILFGICSYLVWLIIKYLIKDPQKKDYLEIENSIALIIATIKEVNIKLDGILKDVHSQLSLFETENKQHHKDIDKLINFTIINLEEKISRIFTDKFSTFFTNINISTISTIDSVHDSINSDISSLRLDLRESISPHIKELNTRVENLNNMIKQNEFNYIRNIDQIRNVLETLKNHCQTQKNLINSSYNSSLILSPLKLKDE